MTMTIVKERPIIFSGPMVNAIIDGTKTQTRRPIKNQNLNGAPPKTFEAYQHDSGYGFCSDDQDWICPYGKPGERLYVREKFSRHRIPSGEPYHYPADRLRECVDHDFGVHYWADGDNGSFEFDKVSPSIHMPRRFSRITLEVAEVGVERVQDISKIDAFSEGVTLPGEEDGDKNCPACGGSGWVMTFSGTESECQCIDDIKFCFRNLWNSIYSQPKPKKVGGVITRYESFPWGGKGGEYNHRGKPHYVYANPWVWAVSFRRVDA